ncbi:hypothetical protein THRCLA_22964, partial [Thraustotheca clavata]
YGITALHLAVAFDDLDMIALLLRAGANPNLRSVSASTPVDLASKKARGIIDIETLPHLHKILPQFLNQSQNREIDMTELQNKVAILQQRVQELEVSNICTICYEQTKDTVFNCGHETCTNCSKLLSNCPNCRKPITARIHRFV